MKIGSTATGDVGIGPYNTGERAYALVLAHELGHYLGLSHTFHSAPDSAKTLDALALDAEVRMTNSGGNVEAAYNGDGLVDTFPDPGPWVFEDRYRLFNAGDPSYHVCEYSSEIWIYGSSSNGQPSGVNNSVDTDRSNIMSYFFCNPSSPPPANYLNEPLTPMQLQKIRDTLATYRTEKIW